MSKREGSIKLSRVVRDPIHGDIPMTTFEFGLLNSVEFQRLRRVRQLGMAHLVYPGAEHSRLSHAVGTLFMAEKILKSVETREGFAFESEERQATRAYALLHDISHAPFGHTLEDELGFFERHDKNVGRMSRLWNRPGDSLSNLLQAAEFGRTVKDLIDRSDDLLPPSRIEEVVSGATGADVLDYIDRDSVFCGLDHRVDSAIFRRFTIDRSKMVRSHAQPILTKLYGSHGFRMDADHAITSVFRERFALFMKVYSHPVKEAAGAMLGKAMSFAMGHDPSFFSEERIETMADDELLYALHSRGGDDARYIIDQLLQRRIFKPVYRAKAMGDADFNVDNYRERRRSLQALGLLNPQTRQVLEREIAAKANVDANMIALYCNKKAPGAQRVIHRVVETEGRVVTRDSVHKAYQNIYNAHLYLWSVYLFTSDDLASGKKQLVAEVCQEKVGLANDTKSDRRQLALDLL